MLKFLAPAFVVVALVASGCSAEPIPESEKILVESSSSPLGPSGGKAKAGNKDATPKPRKKKAPPSTSNVVVAPGLGVKFTAPKGWSPLTDAAADRLPDSQFAELAAKVGMTAEQLRSGLSDAELLVVGPTGSINASGIGTAQALPSEAEFRANLGNTFDITSVEDISTALGQARVVYYGLSTSSGTVRGAGLFVIVDGTVVDITTTTGDSASTRDLLAKVARTLKRA